MEIFKSIQAVHREQVPMFGGNKNSIEKTADSLDAVQVYIAKLVSNLHKKHHRICKVKSYVPLHDWLATCGVEFSSSHLACAEISLQDLLT
ncbi:hypothetical protein BJ085DRAFT_35536 [Dimargaris cristalligena]|uniref:Uncharacterized protein n=1 Tax=Dimargaris cristalligena TaxID=215637 RepID=A0A4P9ZP83_9FUNG|nr:hypothetical protein BJ085DRAFT_35536 [Dimargaris cristalligena]|eukprot:RKP34451.1 hypothetical protein BJ085DRAFT_35536 [Dimargaris cristalligena]